MSIDIQQLTQAVSEEVDRQCGLDVNTFSVDNNGDFIRLRVKIFNDRMSRSKTMEAEWEATGEAVIDFLDRQGLGKYKIISVSGCHCQLERILEERNHWRE
jgi:hypothetical protein